ncbi:hypothetical protein CYV26_11055 [Carnobacterium maltaromaticum]|uniref:hypothetical protein n=1 Tax=Carnobacterium maltaromaticum TaxID=2751 RepID=UPI000C788A60|nr:hypothetical protein [Carnobacterium maltaromaticum]PLS34044.1 hypothetical protein CYV30_12220 [Carnobacterium maltaromaticum]PLS34179.1 hypothetical protein CYV33_11040 [Carnobacterium maltaromaticum]PLS34315.1 hypothetical protein CYV31_12200 [Carnobacterium maltaromaticum]PLS41643.1 hypothetical protein CYV28_12155 [Carnobacterium maltaromaticum]PLS43125.1 hypothetical protein CYV27_11040 [Carnobacterium maltaromaticum]
MKKSTVLTATLLAVSSLGFATNANAAIAEKESITNQTVEVAVNEGQSIVELETGKELSTFDFNRITEETKSFEDTVEISSTILNKTFGEKVYTLSIEKNLSAGLDAALQGTTTVKQAENGLLKADMLISLDAKTYVPSDSNKVVVTISESTAEVKPDPEPEG